MTRLFLIFICAATFTVAAPAKEVKVPNQSDVWETLSKCIPGYGDRPGHSTATCNSADGGYPRSRRGPPVSAMFKIQSAYGCPGDALCDAELSWDMDGKAKGLATVEHNDPVPWVISYVLGGAFEIKSAYDCPSDKLCGGYLTWDKSNPLAPELMQSKGMATVVKSDDRKWFLIPSPRNPDLYMIKPADKNGPRADYQQGGGCDTNLCKYGSLSWDRDGKDKKRRAKGRATLEFNDPVFWRITPIPGCRWQSSSMFVCPI